MLKLPETPTPEQLKGIVLAIIRETFEDSAENVQDIKPLGEGGWKTIYSADEVDFNLTYDGETFEKWPVGGGQDG